MLATSTPTEALWYLTRATGLVSLALLTLVMVLGVTQAQRWAPPRWPRFVTSALHRNASLLAVAFLAVHILSAVVDRYAPIDLAAVVIPFSSPYRPVWLGLGALAFDLVIALLVTSMLRPHINGRLWRLVHWSAYGCWPIALVHGLGTGSDGRVGWVQVVYASCLAAVLVAVLWRVITIERVEPAGRLALVLGTSFAALVIVGWAAVGPSQPHWAARSGTPRKLLRPPSSTTCPTTITGPCR